MVVESRVIDEHNFLNLERGEDGRIVGKLIRLTPVEADSSVHIATGTYREFRTAPCSSTGEAEIAVFTLLKRLSEQEK